MSLSDRHLVLSVTYDDQVVGRIILATDVHRSVLRASDITTPRAVSAPILSATNTSYAIHAIYVSEFDPSIEGYSILAPRTTPLLDENRIGPNHIDSIGSLKEVPGVGWK